MCVQLNRHLMLQDRVRGKQYESFIDEVVFALRQRYGETLIIHWEDFGVGNSFRLLEKYRDQVRAAACVPGWSAPPWACLVEAVCICCSLCAACC